MRKSETLSYARAEDDSLFWVGHRKPPVYAVRLHAETTPILAALLEESSLTAAALINAALVAVWLAHAKQEAQRARPPRNGGTTETPPSVGELLRGMIDDTTRKVQMEEEPRRRNLGRPARRVYVPPKR